MRNAEHLRIENCEIAHTGNSGIHIKDSYDTKLLNNRLHNLGFYGISSSQSNTYESKASEDMQNLLIQGNFIDGCGYTNYITPYCIFVGGRQGIKVLSNDVMNSALGLIMIKGFSHGTVRSKNFVQFVVKYNRADNFGQGQLSDYAAIKTGVPSCRAVCPTCKPYDDANKQRSECSVYARVSNNIILNGQGWHHGGTAYLYSDAASCRTTFEKNILYGSKAYLPIIHNCGIDNLSTNNILHKTWPMDTSKNKLWVYCPGKDTKHKSATYEKNIILFDNLDENFQVIARHINLKGATFRDNIYWSRASESHKSIKMFPWIAYEGQIVKHPNYARNNRTYTFHEGDIIDLQFTEWLNFTDWKASHHDQNSLWQDPMFRNPANHNYAFKKNSPATGLGIQPVNTRFIRVLDRNTKKHHEEMKKTSEFLNNYFS